MYMLLYPTLLLVTCSANVGLALTQEVSVVSVVVELVCVDLGVRCVWVDWTSVVVVVPTVSVVDDVRSTIVRVEVPTVFRIVSVLSVVYAVAVLRDVVETVTMTVVTLVVVVVVYGTVMVTDGAARSVVAAVKPRQEQALENLTAPLQGVA